MKIVRADESSAEELIRPYPRTWWLKRACYLRYVIRDFTSFPIAMYGIFLLVTMLYAGQSEESFQRFLGWLQTPGSIFFHLLVFIFATYHSITFFGFTPRVIPIYLKARRLPDVFIVTVHYILWGLISFALVYYVWTFE